MDDETRQPDPKPEPKPAKPTPVDPQPSLGRIVIYRTRDGVDIAAVITAVIDAEEGTVHLEQFPPPGIGKDLIAYQFGVPFEDYAIRHHTVPIGEDGHPRGCWRWPERV